MPGTKCPQHKNLIIMFKWMSISPENCQKKKKKKTHPIKRVLFMVMVSAASLGDVLSLLSRGGGGGVQVGGP